MSPDQLPPLRGRSTVTTVLIVVVLIALCLVVWMYRDTPLLSRFLGSAPVMAPVQTGQPQSTVAYSCDQNKVLVAQYYEGPSSVAANGLPIPGGHVVLTLHDGNMMSVPQTVSVDGTRYANADESFVFWSKGNMAFIQQGDTQTYTGCIAQSAKTAGEQNWKAYASSALGFSILYPQNYIVDTSYANQLLGPGKAIKGVKFTISASMADGTNLSNDSGVSVEVATSTAVCSANLFASAGTKIHTMTENGTAYSVASTSGAGAGNLYSEVVYVIQGTNPCTAVRYFVHSTQLGNYSAGTRTAFDQNALMQQFDMIRQSLVLGR